MDYLEFYRRTVFNCVSFNYSIFSEQPTYRWDRNSFVLRLFDFHPQIWNYYVEYNDENVHYPDDNSSLAVEKHLTIPDILISMNVRLTFPDGEADFRLLLYVLIENDIITVRWSNEYGQKISCDVIDAIKRVAIAS